MALAVKITPKITQVAICGTWLILTASFVFGLLYIYLVQTASHLADNHILKYKYALTV